MKATEIRKNELRDLFTGSATTLPGEGKVVPILLKAGTVYEAFLQVYIGKSDALYRACWRSLVFSGEGSMPKILESDTAVVELVAHNTGAIGHIGKITPHEGVRVLAVK